MSKYEEKLLTLDETEAETESEELEPPSEFICGLTMEIMDDPLMSKYGHNYERAAILEWLTSGHDTCPMTRQPMRLSDLISNRCLRTRIHEWKKEHRDDTTLFLGEELANAEPQCFGIIHVNNHESQRRQQPLLMHQNALRRQHGLGSSRRRRRSAHQTIEIRRTTESSTRGSHHDGVSARFLKHFFRRGAVSSDEDRTM